MKERLKKLGIMATTTAFAALVVMLVADWGHGLGYLKWWGAIIAARIALAGGDRAQDWIDRKRARKVAA